MQQPNGNKPSRNPLRGNDRNQEGGKPGQGQGKGKPDAPRRPRIPTWIVGVLILGLLAWNAWRIFGPDDGESRITVPYSVLVAQVEASNVSEVTISDTHVNADLKQEIVFDSDTNQVVTDAPSDPPSSFNEDTEIRAELPPATDISVSLLPILEEQGVTITGNHDSGSLWTGLLFSFLPVPALPRPDHLHGPPDDAAASRTSSASAAAGPGRTTPSGRRSPSPTSPARTRPSRS